MATPLPPHESVSLFKNRKGTVAALLSSALSRLCIITRAIFRVASPVRPGTFYYAVDTWPAITSAPLPQPLTLQRGRRDRGVRAAAPYPLHEAAFSEYRFIET